jgi:hypothetical protein
MDPSDLSSSAERAEGLHGVAADAGRVIAGPVGGALDLKCA